MEYIHIAGTNAKGSVAEYLYTILIEAGYKCGVFTSPHLFSPRERMRINGEMIGEEAYQKYMLAAGGNKKEHLFCVWTRAALAWFADNNVDFAVIEAGIGGQKDSTNVIHAKTALLTPVSLDHTKILGDTPETIAKDKCGIIKQGAHVFTYGQTAGVLAIIQEECRKKNAELRGIDQHYVKKADLQGQIFDYKKLKGLQISAISPHQVQNACCAAEAALFLGIREAAIREGLKNTCLQARMQVVANNLIVDGGHNPAAMREAGLVLQKYFLGKKVLALTAVMRDKDAVGIAGEIQKFAGEVVCSCPKNERGLPAREYVGCFDEAIYFPDAKAAYAYAVNQQYDVLVVCGSFYFAAEILKII